MRGAGAAVTVFLLLFGVYLGLVACGGGPALTPEQQAVQDLAGRLEQRLPHPLWREIESQPWYDGASTPPDGVRLLRTLYGLGLGADENDVRALLAAYPRGIEERISEAAERLARLRSVDYFLLRPWVRDGITADERLLVGLLDGRPALTVRLLEVLERRDAWFADGISADEHALLRLARVSASSSFVELLLSVLSESRFSSWALDLGSAGQKQGILIWSTSIPEQARQRTLALLRELTPKVAAFAGPFPGETLVVYLNELATLCSADATPGRGNPALGSAADEFESGVVTLAPGCVQAQTLTHELTHVFVSGEFPTWFAEGIADVASYHITGQVGYAGGSGRLRLERRETDSSEPFLRSPYYQEAARGTAMMLQLYRLLGPEAVSNVLKASGNELRVSGARALELILAQATPEQVAAVKAVFARWVDGYVP